MFLSMIMLMGVLMLTGCWDTGGGEKIGVITRINKVGAFCKTWEGEIIRGGINNGTGAMGTAFHFTIENDPALVKKVQDAMEHQTEVKISYRSEGITFCRSESEDERGRNVFLTGIEEIHPVGIDRPANVNTYVKPTEGWTQRDEDLKALGELTLRLQQGGVAPPPAPN